MDLDKNIYIRVSDGCRVLGNSLEQGVEYVLLGNENAPKSDAKEKVEELVEEPKETVKKAVKKAVRKVTKKKSAKA